MEPFVHPDPRQRPLPEGRAKLIRVILTATRSRDLTITEGAALLRNTADESRDWQTYYKMLDRL